jgi:hypothetical protein
VRLISVAARELAGRRIKPDAPAALETESVAADVSIGNILADEEFVVTLRFGRCGEVDLGLGNPPVFIISGDAADAHAMVKLADVGEPPESGKVKRGGSNGGCAGWHKNSLRVRLSCVLESITDYFVFIVSCGFSRKSHFS